MSKSPEISAPPGVVPDSDFSCTHSDASVPTASQTESTSPAKSLGNAYFYDDNALSYSGYPSSDYETYVTDEEGSVAPYMYGGVYGQDDIVGQYLALKAAQQSERLQAPAAHNVSEHAGYIYPGHQSIATHDPHISTQSRHGYPDPESIRHLHTLHSLLEHIQPERKLNALGGHVLDIHSGSYDGPVLCMAVPKKLLVLFLGRSIVSRYLHTISRQDNINWTGRPTRQSLILPATIASSSALIILVAWMTRACIYATMETMRPLAVPENLFSACTLAQTMDLLGLRRDAYRVDLEISARLGSKRPLFAVEVEALWRCLGEGNRYVYAVVKAFGRKTSAAFTLAPAIVAPGESASAVTSKSGSEAEGSMCAAPEGLQPPPPEATAASELLRLRAQYPRLYDRILNEALNKQFAPHFGRNWFTNLAGGGGGGSEKASSSSSPPSAYSPPPASAETHGTRASSASDAARAAGGGGGRRSGGGGAAARPLDPRARVFVFRPAAAGCGGGGV